MLHLLILSWRFFPAIRRKALRWHSKSSFRLDILLPLLCSEMRYSVTVLSFGNKSILTSSARSTVRGRLPGSALERGKCHYWFWWLFPLCSDAFIPSILILCRTCFESYHRESPEQVEEIVKPHCKQVCFFFLIISEQYDFQFQKELKPCEKTKFEHVTVKLHFSRNSMLSCKLSMN